MIVVPMQEELGDEMLGGREMAPPNGVAQDLLSFYLMEQLK